MVDEKRIHDTLRYSVAQRGEEAVMAPQKHRGCSQDRYWHQRKMQLCSAVMYQNYIFSYSFMSATPFPLLCLCLGWGDQAVGLHYLVYAPMAYTVIQVLCDLQYACRI